MVRDDIADEVDSRIMAFSEQLHCEVVARRVQPDHGHLVVMITAMTAVSDGVLNKFRHPKEKPYWGSHFSSKGYCADTVVLDEE